MKAGEEPSRLGDGVGLRAGALEAPGVNVAEAGEGPEAEEGIPGPEHESDERPLAVDHDARHAPRLEHAEHFGDRLLRVRTVVKHSPGPDDIEFAGRKVEVLRVP